MLGNVLVGSKHSLRPRSWWLVPLSPLPPAPPFLRPLERSCCGPPCHPCWPPVCQCLAARQSPLALGHVPPSHSTCRQYHRLCSSRLTSSASPRSTSAIMAAASARFVFARSRRRRARYVAPPPRPTPTRVARRDQHAALPTAATAAGTNGQLSDPIKADSPDRQGPQSKARPSC